MYTVFVTIDVDPASVDEFVEAIKVNSEASLRDEVGCLRFDVHRALDDPNRFYLYEIYRDEDAFFVEHRGAPHYAAFREVVSRTVPAGTENVFAEPVFPERIPERPART
jgi:autoinducer 2-degrading protein